MPRGIAEESAMTDRVPFVCASWCLLTLVAGCAEKWESQAGHAGGDPAEARGVHPAPSAAQEKREDHAERERAAAAMLKPARTAAEIRLGQPEPALAP